MKQHVEPDPFPPAGRPAVSLVRVAARTDIGKNRKNNEDSFLVGDLARDRPLTEPFDDELAIVSGRFFCAVCDGMGGEAGGEVASKLAIEALYLAMRERAPLDGSVAALAEALRESVQIASNRVARVAREQPEYARMGTTATVAALTRGTLAVAQVGDSRGYLLRDRKLMTLTKDQTLLTFLIESGQLAPENAERFEAGHVILQAVGSSPKLEIPITEIEVWRGDRFLFCSDGLSGPVSDDEIARVLIEEKSVADACDRLIFTANENGGPDNVTAIVLQF